MACEHILDRKCPKGHIQTWKCHESPPSICSKCERAAKVEEQKKAKAAALQKKRDAEDLAHAQRLADIDEKIAAEAQAHRDRQLALDRIRAIEQKQKDLESAISRTSQAVATPGPLSTAGVSDEEPSPSPPTSSKPSSGRTQPVPNPLQTTPKAKKSPISVSTQPNVPSLSESQKNWRRRKEIDGANNDAIDSIMDMIGLEEVKAQVLRIYERIEVTKRQGTSLKDERFNIVLLGNPGTGKPCFRTNSIVCKV